MTTTENVLNLIHGKKQAAEVVNAIAQEYGLTLQAVVPAEEPYVPLDLDITQATYWTLQTVAMDHYGGEHYEVAWFMEAHKRDLAPVILDQHPKQHDIHRLVENLWTMLTTGNWSLEVAVADEHGRISHLVDSSPVERSIVAAQKQLPALVHKSQDKGVSYRLVRHSENPSDVLELKFNLN